MEEILVLVAIGLLIVAFVLPIVALVMASNARRANQRLEQALHALELEIRNLQRAARAAPAAEPAAPRVESIPVAPPFQPPAPAPVPPPPVPVAPPPLVPPPIPLVRPLSATVTAPPPIVVPPTPPPVPEPAEEPAPSFNWEQFMGVKLFAWLGGLALFLGAAFFLKLSIDRGWIPPALRVAMGFVTGAALLVGGLWSARRSYVTTGHSLCATGVVTLYAVTFACRALYDFEFFGVIQTFVLMTLITAVAFLLAVRLSAQVVAILGLLGGFLTPKLLSTDVDNPLGLFGYLALLDIGLLAVAVRCHWHHLAVLAAAGTAAMQAGWADKFFALEKLPIAVGVCALFVTLFTSAVAVTRRFAKTTDWLAGAALVPAATAFGFSIYFCSLPAVAAQPGWVLGNVLFADLALLTLAVLHVPMLRLHLIAGLTVLGIAALWIAEAATNNLLPWALGFVFLFAALHTVFPFIARRFRPDVDETRLTGLFAPVSLLVLLIPVLQLEAVSWLLWPVVLLVNVLALAAAVISRMFIALAAAILLTLVVLGVAVTQVQVGGGMLELGLTAGFAVFFVAAAVWAMRRFGSESEDSPAFAPWLAHLPGASAALPFVLLVMLVYRLQPLDPSSIFGVALLLNLLVIGLCVVARQGALVVAGFIGTLLVEYAWQGAWMAGRADGVALAWFAGFSALFLVFPFLVRQRMLDLQPPWAVAALSLPLHFYLLHKTVGVVWPNDVPGALPAACALPPLVGLIVLVRAIPADAEFRLNRLAWFGAATLFFITLIFPLQFWEHGPQWITIGWALEGAALLWLFHRVPHPGLRVAGVGLLIAVFARLILNDSIFDYAARGEQPVFNWILYTYGIATLCCFTGAHLLAPPRDRVLGWPAPVLLATMGTILAFALVNLEIADYFTPAGRRLTLDFSGNFARDMSYTIAWALFALVLLGTGIVKRLRAVRYAAIALLGVTLLKLFFHDLASLEQLYRVAALMVVAVVAIAASFLYQRFLGRLEKKSS